MSRETRLLLIAALVAVAVLWLLARVRFRDRPTPPSPIPAVLSQLTGRPKLDELAAEIEELSNRLRASVVAVDLSQAAGTLSGLPVAGLRVRDDIAVAWIPDPTGAAPAGLIALDRAAGLALLRVPAVTRPQPAVWTPRTTPGARYVVATEIVGATVSLRPAFMPAFEPMPTPLWRDPLWAVPAGVGLRPGSLVFTSDGEVVGLVITFAGRQAIVPAATLLGQAQRLIATPRAPAGVVGVAVQDLTPALAAATGSTAGVVVSWVADGGPAHDHLRVGDVIEAVDGRVVNGRVAWDVVAARLAPGSTLALRVRRGTSVQDVSVTAAAPAAPPSSAALGVTLRVRPRRGAEIVAVEPGSAGDRAGLAEADVITLAGDVAAPTPQQVSRAFGALQPGARMLVGVTRGDTHFVTTLERAR